MALVVILYTCIKILRFNICYIKSNVLTLEPYKIVGWDIYIVSIDTGVQVVIILLAFGPYVVIVNLFGIGCTLGRAPCTMETLPDFHE